MRLGIVMRLGGSLVDTLHKDVIQFLSHNDLRMLKLRQGIHHDSIMEVLLDHSLQEIQVIVREL